MCFSQPNFVWNKKGHCRIYDENGDQRSSTSPFRKVVTISPNMHQSTVIMSTRSLVSVSRRSIAASSYTVSAFHSYSCGNSAVAFSFHIDVFLTATTISDPTRVFHVKKSNSMHISIYIGIINVIIVVQLSSCGVCCK